eukprot:350653-Chlamydomonas_euryale.AAC.6
MSTPHPAGNSVLASSRPVSVHFRISAEPFSAPKTGAYGRSLLGLKLGGGGAVCCMHGNQGRVESTHSFAAVALVNSPPLGA